MFVTSVNCVTLECPLTQLFFTVTLSSYAAYRRGRRRMSSLTRAGTP